MYEVICISICIVNEISNYLYRDIYSNRHVKGPTSGYIYHYRGLTLAIWGYILLSRCEMTYVRIEDLCHIAKTYHNGN